MKTRKSVLLILSSGGMLLSVFYAWTSFIFACISQKPIPLSAVGLILFVATLILNIIALYVVRKYREQYE